MSARVIVTGAAGGIGAATVEKLRSRGARVAGLDLRGDDDVIACDVRDQASVDAAVAEAIERLGGLDVLINNASSLGPTPLAPLVDTECEDLEQALAVNVLGPFRLTKALFGALAASARNERGALVINISSDAAINAYSGWGAYGASKAALRHLTAIWAEEAKADRVGFLSIDPGDMNTPLHALAIPDADPLTLRRPEDSAAELVETMRAALSSRIGQLDGAHP
jgi:NAD(P)-dependent dehydrogenase (short-subunit alcohol dehydrogenase family)